MSRRESQISNLRSQSVVSDSKETHKASFTVQASVSYLDFKVSEIGFDSRVSKFEI